MKPSQYIKKGWTRGSLSRSAKGESAYCNPETSVCWCALGAINASTDDYQKRSNIIYDLNVAIGNGKSRDPKSITIWNDFRANQSEVIAALESIGQ